MENNYKSENELLRKNIERLEQGITLEEYLQDEQQFLINGSIDTYEIYYCFGFFMLYDRTQKFYRTGSMSRSDICEWGWYEFIKNDEIVIKYYRANEEEWPSIEKYILRKNDERYYEYYRIQINKKFDEVLKHCGHLGIQHFADALPELKYRVYNEMGKSKMFAMKLLRLYRKSKTQYEVLNAMLDIFVKAALIFVVLLCINRPYIANSTSTIYNIFSEIVFVIGGYLGSVILYLALLGIIFVIHFIVCKEKYSIKLKIFNMIINTNLKKAWEYQYPNRKKIVE
ncbi:hypothetical protein [Eubacterium ramulus]|uniref:hypothetical protein n=1 Tax=Eubacterium ramulus TaxID=39490 RepID=UPI0022E3230B|nr:hypothetical protein [Eubacterium ramulus]